MVVRQTDGRTDGLVESAFLFCPAHPYHALQFARERETEKETDTQVCKWQRKETPFDARRVYIE